MPVKDEAGYFKPETLAGARQRIKAIRQQDHKDVLVETFAALPADKKEAFAKLDPEDVKGRGQFFADWLAERARAAGAGGVQVLICKDPPRIQIGVAQDSARNIRAADRDQLREMLAALSRKAKRIRV